SAYKPRTSPYSFQGLGTQGLTFHKQAQQKHGLAIETEVLDVRDVDVVAAHVDLIRIGARNMQHFPLLKEMGRITKPVLLKRGFGSTIDEWLMSAEYILSHGNPNVILCERGIRTFEPSTRATLDISSIAVLRERTHLPVIADPSHAAGKKNFVAPLAKAALAAGADGLLIEVHHDPESALCDGSQAINLEEFARLLDELDLIARAVGRTLYRE
ncbi:MAG: phospho-2-dehydro-3-deoxyheptonate aldolase, partial [Chlamydiota bacterium]